MRVAARLTLSISVPGGIDAEALFTALELLDLARTGQVVNVLQPLTSFTITQANSCFPIPQREINATNGTVVQNPGY